ncbi:MAG TPA: hypothetical protein VEI96_13110 [Thermodesulfovibrionales bacterium]|nr:hypothetical protein [Thermodesulfovibrionales bacterium]
MLKKFFLIVLFLAFAIGAEAAPFAFGPFPCASGGTVMLTGDWNQATGALTATFTKSVCQEGGLTASGQTQASGTLILTTPITGNINITYSLTETDTDGSNSRTTSCTGDFAGAFSLVTLVIQGGGTKTCTDTGTTSLPDFVVIGP